MYQLSEDGQEKLRKKTRRTLIILFSELAVFIGCVILGCFYYLNYPRVEEELTREAGSDLPKLSEFLLKDYKEAAFVTPLNQIADMNKPGDYEVAINIAGREYISVLHIVDTVAPVVEVREAEIYTDETLEISDLIVSIDDVTETTVNFVNTPDFTRPGVQNVPILITDEGGNSVQVFAKVEVLADTEAPIIEGVQELTVKAGGSVSYKRDVTVTDNHDENMVLVVDNSEVNLNKVGDYTVIYSAEDNAGNRTEITTVLHVLPAGVEGATEDIVYAEADAILAEIITEDMSQYEVAETIFHWINQNIANVGTSPKTTWVEGAYRGLFERKGDCFVYASLSKCMLDRAGIPNMIIMFSNSRMTHYWNLIDLGEGWYHWDVIRRTSGLYFFYVSDAELMKYSNAHNGTHAYDPSQYPEIQ